MNEDKYATDTPKSEQYIHPRTTSQSSLLLASNKLRNDKSDGQIQKFTQFNASHF